MCISRERLHIIQAILSKAGGILPKFPIHSPVKLVKQMNFLLYHHPEILSEVFLEMLGEYGSRRFLRCIFFLFFVRMLGDKKDTLYTLDAANCWTNDEKAVSKKIGLICTIGGKSVPRKLRLELFKVLRAHKLT